MVGGDIQTDPWLHPRNESFGNPIDNRQLRAPRVGVGTAHVPHEVERADIHIDQRPVALRGSIDRTSNRVALAIRSAPPAAAQHRPGQTSAGEVVERAHRRRDAGRVSSLPDGLARLQLLLTP